MKKCVLTCIILVTKAVSYSVLLLSLFLLLKTNGIAFIRIFLSYGICDNIQYVHLVAGLFPFNF